MVGIGGFFGAIARYLIGEWVVGKGDSGFPYGTFVVNVSGCFVLALFVTLITERFIIHPHWRLLVAVGFLGAYTTFSTFEYETNKLIEAGSFWLALLNMFMSLASGMIAIRIGVALGRKI
jgi:CrcB protein